MRVEALPAFGAKSNSFAFTVDTVASSIAANVVGVAEDGGPIADNAATTDTTPNVSGALAGGTLAAGDVVSVLRNGAVVGSASVSGTSWAYAETSALPLGTYSYTARVVDAAGNLGAVGTRWTIRIISLPTTTITQLLNNPGGSVLAPGSVTTDSTPRVVGTINQALVGPQLVRVLRNGTAVGTAVVSGTGWTFDDNAGASVSGTQTYTARAEDSPVLGVLSAGYAILIDNVLPAQAANVTGLTDDFLGAVPDGGSTTDSTPQVSGSLSAALNATTGSTESLQVLRNGAVLAATPTITFPNWTVTDPGPMTAGTTYTYSARVVDAAGNVGAAGTTRAATYDATTRTASISTALNGSTTIVAGTTTADTTPEIQGTVNAALLAGQWVRVLRDGVAVSGQITPTGTTWTYTDTISGSVTQSYAYTARVETASVNGAQSTPAYTFTVDNIRPAQGFSISAISDVTPSSTLSGAIPPNNNIPAGGTTNDPRPSVRVQLSGALASGETLVVRRVLNGSAVTDIAPPQSSCGANCIQFTESADVVSIPLPLSAPNSGLPGAGAIQYRVSVRDAALNETLTPDTFSFTFDYFNCSQARATAGSSGHTTLSASANPTANCQGCHTGTLVGGATPAGTFVPAPRGVPTYWCHRPG